MPEPLSNESLLRYAETHKPPQSWYDEDIEGLTMPELTLEQRRESIKAALRRNELMDLICRADRGEYPSDLLVECLHEVEWEETRLVIVTCLCAVAAVAAVALGIIFLWGHQ